MRTHLEVSVGVLLLEDDTKSLFNINQEATWSRRSDLIVRQSTIAHDLVIVHGRGTTLVATWNAGLLSASSGS